MGIDFEMGWVKRDLRSVDAERSSRVLSVTGNIIESQGFVAGMGAMCVIDDPSGGHPEVLAEVVSFDKETIKLIPYHETTGLSRRSRVRFFSESVGLSVSDDLLGRVINPLGEIIDSQQVTRDSRNATHFSGSKIPPLEKASINQPLDVGVRVINALLTMAKGQRIGLVAGSGVGKSTLMAMITKHTDADVVIVGLIGERGREAREFIEDTLGPEGLRKAIIVLATSDTTAVMRRRGAEVCHILAEYFRDKGQNVLLLCDSLTRVAHAQREIGLAVGEPPTSKGYPPSVFTELPKLMERGGMGRPGSGSISSIYTVLAEYDEGMDPIVEIARATLDGQIMLSRQLADAGHYPAIDLNGSISRLAAKVVSDEVLDAATRYRRYWSLYEQNKDIINIGAYKSGADESLDVAVRMRSSMVKFARQSVDLAAGMDESAESLLALMGES